MVSTIILSSLLAAAASVHATPVPAGIALSVPEVQNNPVKPFAPRAAFSAKAHRPKPKFPIKVPKLPKFPARGAASVRDQHNDGIKPHTIAKTSDFESQIATQPSVSDHPLLNVMISSTPDREPQFHTNSADHVVPVDELANVGITTGFPFSFLHTHSRNYPQPHRRCSSPDDSPRGSQEGSHTGSHSLTATGHPSQHTDSTDDTATSALNVGAAAGLGAGLSTSLGALVNGLGTVQAGATLLPAVDAPGRQPGASTKGTNAPLDALVNAGLGTSVPANANLLSAGGVVVGGPGRSSSASTKGTDATLGALVNTDPGTSVRISTNLLPGLGRPSGASTKGTDAALGAVVDAGLGTSVKSSANLLSAASVVVGAPGRPSGASTKNTGASLGAILNTGLGASAHTGSGASTTGGLVLDPLSVESIKGSDALSVDAKSGLGVALSGSRNSASASSIGVDTGVSVPAIGTHVNALDTGNVLIHPTIPNEGKHHHHATHNTTASAYVTSSALMVTCADLQALGIGMDLVDNSCPNNTPSRRPAPSTTPIKINQYASAATSILTCADLNGLGVDTALYAKFLSSSKCNDPSIHVATTHVKCNDLVSLGVDPTCPLSMLNGASLCK